MNTSVIWIAPPAASRIDLWLGKVRGAGLLPVRVNSADGALEVLKQFRAGVVVYQAAAENGAGDCERLVAAGAPVVAVIEDSRYAQIYLSVGCAAAVTEGCPGTVLVGILKNVAGGQRHILWPELASGAIPESAAG